MFVKPNGLEGRGAETFSENKNDNKQARNSFGIAGFQMVEMRGVEPLSLSLSNAPSTCVVVL